jgi:hypothetical protein
MILPEFYSVYNPKDFHRCTQPQRVIFVVFKGDLVRINYRMGDCAFPHTMINVMGSKDKPMELHNDQPVDLTKDYARGIWKWLVDELGWVNGG